MPNYDYVCKECKSVTTRMVSFYNEPPKLVRCIGCGKRAAKKVTVYTPLVNGDLPTRQPF